MRPFPNIEDGSWLITEGSSAFPIWSRGGDELAFVDLDDRMARSVTVMADGTFRSGPSEPLFSLIRYRFTSGMAMDPGGERFLLPRSGDEQESEQRLVLMQNVFQLLRERVGG